MRQIQYYIQQKNQKFAEHPLFTFLRDDSIDPRQRLSIAPCMAHFTMSFGDLNRYVYRDTQRYTDDPFQRFINEHSEEDDHHWLWFLKDIETLGFDPELRFSEALRLLWSEETADTRRLSYELAGCILGAEPVYKFIVLESIEAIVLVFFSSTRHAANDLLRRTGRECLYFGDYHLAREAEHAMSPSARELRKVIDAFEMSPAMREQGRRLVDMCYAILTRSVANLHGYALVHPAWPPRPRAAARADRPAAAEKRA